MKKLISKNSTKFLVVIFSVAVLVGSFTLYCSKTYADWCEGAPMDCSQVCEQNAYELVESTSAQDTTCVSPKTLKENTGYCGEYFNYTYTGDSGPECREFICSSDYRRTTSNCTMRL